MNSIFKKEIHTEIGIDASPDAVWDVLVDLVSYPDWNPMVKKAGGEVRVGERLRLHYEPEGHRKRTFNPLLLVVEPGRELRWRGQPGMRFLFESEHIYILKETPEGNTHLDHDMIFYGLIIPAVRHFIEKATRKPFNDLNRAMKDRVEGEK
jgi:hypothetical protein